MGSLIETRVFEVDPKNPGLEEIGACAKILKKGGLVAFPTETVYGLAANFLDEKAVDRVYEVKKRPRSKPLTIQVPDAQAIEGFGCEMIPDARVLMEDFWPGALTIILMSKDGKKMGFRIPKNEVALRLIEGSGVPIVAPSANLSGESPPRDPKSVLDSLGGKIEALLDGGPTELGIESTVVDLTVEPPKILRRGAIEEFRILEALSKKGS